MPWTTTRWVGVQVWVWGRYGVAGWGPRGPCKLVHIVRFACSAVRDGSAHS